MISPKLSMEFETEVLSLSVQANFGLGAKIILYREGWLHCTQELACTIVLCQTVKSYPTNV